MDNLNGPSDIALHSPSQFRRAAIDAEFAQMAQDYDYQREAVEISESFATADWEALLLDLPEPDLLQDTALSP